MPGSKKAERLKQKALATVRTPKTGALLAAAPERRSYRVVAVSLYTPEADWIDQATRALQAAGNPKASRSLVVREAVLRLQDALARLSPQQLLEDFTREQARRGRRHL